MQRCAFILIERAWLILSMLRKFQPSDQALVALRFGRSPEEASRLIHEWNTGSYQGRYFEMYAVVHDETVVGTISLCARSKSVISIGPEIVEETMFFSI